MLKAERSSFTWIPLSDERIFGKNIISSMATVVLTRSWLVLQCTVMGHVETILYGLYGARFKMGWTLQRTVPCEGHISNHAFWVYLGANGNEPRMFRCWLCTRYQA